VAAVALTLALLLALVVALLAVPLTVAFSIRRIGDMRGYVRFRWLFGLVRFQLRIPRAADARTRPAPAPRKKAGPPRRKRRKGGAAGVVSAIGQAALRRRVYRFIGDLLRATHARDLFCRLRIGLGDPADTGCLWAFVGPIAGMAQTIQAATVRIEPEFMDPVFEVESRGRFSLVPLQFVAIVTAFLLSPTMLPVWWQICRGSG